MMRIVAEPSCSHRGDYNRAVRLVIHASQAGASSIKLQPYEPGDHNPESDHSAYRLTSGPWAGRSLQGIYEEGQTPYAWLPGLISIANDIGLPWFASVVSARGLDVLESLGCSEYKIPSAEVADTRFVELVASAGKPVILSDGMATPSQMSAAMAAVVRAGADLTVLKCVSEYPAKPEGYNLATLRSLQANGIACGVSDHTTGNTIPVMAATLGCAMLEKHLMAEDYWQYEPLDIGHSLSPTGFARMVKAVREAEAAMGSVVLGASVEAGKGWRRRLVAARDLPAGHTLAQRDVTTARCGIGLEPDEQFVGRTITRALSEGDPIPSSSASPDGF